MPCLFLVPSDPRRSKRAAATTSATNIGSDARYPSWQIGSAHSLSSAAPPAEKDDIVRTVRELVGILKVAPEHQRAVQPAVDLIQRQVMQIEELRGTLIDVRAELNFIVGGLGGEELEIITALQDMIYDVLDMTDAQGEGLSSSSTTTTTPNLVFLLLAFHFTAHVFVVFGFVVFLFVLLFIVFCPHGPAADEEAARGHGGVGRRERSVPAGEQGQVGGGGGEARVAPARGARRGQYHR